MSDNLTEARALRGHIAITFMVQCNRCRIVGTATEDQSWESSAAELYKRGWRVFETQAWCPDCAKGKW